MRRAAACMIGMAMLLTACRPAVEHGLFVNTLIGFCAQVNRALAGVVATEQPQQYADELNGLIEQIENEPAPAEDRETLEDMMASFRATADQFEEAAEAKERGNEEVVEAEAAVAQERFAETNEIAQQYGMPDLTTCQHVVEGTTPSPSTDVAQESSETPTAPETPTPEPAPETASFGWRPLDMTLSARVHAAAARVGGLIYVAGGIEDGAATATVEAFEPTLGQQREFPPLPTPLHNAMAVSYRDQLVVLGGWRPTGGELFGEPSDEVFVLRDGQWDRLPPLRRPRAAGAAAVVDDQIIVVGGRRRYRTIAAIEIFDGERWRDGARIPRRRDTLAAASDGRHVYAVGGRRASAAENVNFFARYDPETDTWVTLPPMPTARGSIGADIVEGRLVVVGGETVGGSLDTVEAYDIGASEWQTFPSLPEPRHGGVVAAVGSSLYSLTGSEDRSVDAATGAVHELTLPPKPLQPSSEWDGLDAAQIARQQVATAEVDGLLWVVGGLRDVDVATTKVEGLDPETGTWQSAPDLPEALHHAMAVNFRDELVVIGGWIPEGSDPDAGVSDAMYVLRDNEWQTLAPLNHARAAGAAGVVDGTLVVVGGQAGNALVPQTEVYDEQANQWNVVRDMPTPREHLAAGAIDGYLYVVGGRTPSGPEANFAELERYDPVADEWETMEPMPTARGSIAASVVGNRLIVVGGETTSRVLDTVEIYDPATNSWTTAPDLPVPRHGPGVAAVGSLVCVIGGAQSIGHTDSSTAVDVLEFE